jgi:polyisoprenoid-binding protein YceI
MSNMRKILVPIVCLLVLAALAGAQAVEYKIDPVHTNVGFTVKHMVISTVRGKFKDVSGTIQYDSKDVSKSSVDVVIKTASISTDNETRDNDLRSGNFFEADKYPDITFKSTKITKQGSGYVAHGIFTLKGVSREIDLPFTLNGVVKDPYGNDRMGVEAGPITINRKDYGVQYNKVLETGGAVVGDEVKIDILLEAVHRAPKPAQ